MQIPSISLCIPEGYGRLEVRMISIEETDVPVRSSLLTLVVELW